MNLFLGLLFAFSCAYAFDNSDEFINEINGKQNLWKAGRNFPVDTPHSLLHALLGAKFLPENELKNIPVKETEIDDSVDIPKSFDSRTQWPKCKSIKEIADQSACGSCWAVSTTTSIQDRICIHSDGQQQPKISAKNLMSCDILAWGCEGGYPIYAWTRWRDSGLVTGGPYGSNIGCQPYPFPPCEHFNTTGSKPGCPKDHFKTPNCTQTCDNPTLNYNNTLIYGKSAYVVPNNATKIQLEIMENGPVVGTFDVYDDFFHYKSGVYVKTSNKLIGAHAVRIIGWGEENSTKYWLVANSWNEDWGDKGLFKIRRGTNECAIEYQVATGLPKPY